MKDSDCFFFSFFKFIAHTFTTKSNMSKILDLSDDEKQTYESAIGVPLTFWRNDNLAVFMSAEDHTLLRVESLSGYTVRAHGFDGEGADLRFTLPESDVFEVYKADDNSKYTKIQIVPTHKVIITEIEAEKSE